jgi:hypothetical protein
MIQTDIEKLNADPFIAEDLKTQGVESIKVDDLNEGRGTFGWIARVQFTDGKQGSVAVIGSTDEFSDNPLNWDNLGIISVEGNINHDIDQTLKDATSIILAVAGIDEDEYYEQNPDQSDEDNRADAYKKIEAEGGVVHSVYCYQHSGIHYGVQQTVPRGRIVGLISATVEDIKAWFSVDEITPEVKQNALDRLKDEVETYNKWVNNEVSMIEVYMSEHLFDTPDDTKEICADDFSVLSKKSVGLAKEVDTIGGLYATQYSEPEYLLYYGLFELDGIGALKKHLEK